MKEVMIFTDFLDLLSEHLPDKPATLEELLSETQFEAPDIDTQNYYFWILKILKENHFVWFTEDEPNSETIFFPGYKLLGAESYIDFRDYAYETLMEYK